MKLIAIAVVASIALAASSAASAQEALAKSAGCLNCHNVDASKKVGPGFKEIFTGVGHTVVEGAKFSGENVKELFSGKK